MRSTTTDEAATARRPVWPSLSVTALLLVAYFVLPVADRDGYTVWRAIGAALCLALVVWIIGRQIKRHMTSPVAPLAGLVQAVIGGILLFALTDYAIAVNLPGEFVGLRTRLDALYFALTTLATVGFGDVHAQGQLARGVVILQMVFNLVVVGAAARILAVQVRRRVGDRKI